MQSVTTLVNDAAMGTDRVARVNGAWRLHRMPAAMEPIYGANEGARLRMECTAGVRLRFRSDTGNVRLALRMGGVVRWVFNGDLVVDTEPAVQFGPGEFRHIWRDVIFRNEERRSRTFDIWLPHLCRADVISLDVDDDSAFAPAPPGAVRWLVYGDSISQGMNATSPARTWFGRCSLALDADVHNFAVGGAILDERLADTVSNERYDLVTVLFGANDFNANVPLAVLKRSAEALLASLIEKKTARRIVMLTPIPYPGRTEPNGLGLNLQAYRDALGETAGTFSKDVRLVRGTDLIPEDKALFADKSHPNDKGSEALAQSMLPILRAETDT